MQSLEEDWQTLKPKNMSFPLKIDSYRQEKDKKPEFQSSTNQFTRKITLAQ